jgi:peptidoglycan-associated lipoprotein
MARNSVWFVALVMTVAVATGACRKKAPIARPSVPPAPPTASNNTVPTPPPPPEPVPDQPVVPPEPVIDSGSSGSLDELNRNSPLRPVFFDLDSSDLTTEGQKILDGNAAVLKQHGSWTITIEGHCDERGSAEYNLALGERRALSARAYLISLGLPADRLRTVSYGKEFPFDPGHDESAYAKNRRAHFVITAK